MGPSACGRTGRWRSTSHYGQGGQITDTYGTHRGPPLYSLGPLGMAVRFELSVESSSITHRKRPEFIETTHHDQPNSDRENMHRLITEHRGMTVKPPGDSEDADKLTRNPGERADSADCLLYRHCG